MRNFNIRLLQISTACLGNMGIFYGIFHGYSTWYIIAGVLSLLLAVLMLIYEPVLRKATVPVWLRLGTGTTIILFSLILARKIEETDSMLAILGWAVLIMFGLWYGFEQLGRADLDRRSKNAGDKLDRLNMLTIIALLGVITGLWAHDVVMAL